MTRPRARKPSRTVAGENPAVLARAFRRLLDDEDPTFLIEDPTGQALIRAASRVKADLIREEASLFHGDPTVFRDDDERTFAAMDELLRRVVAAARADHQRTRRRSA